MTHRRAEPLSGKTCCTWDGSLRRHALPWVLLWIPLLLVGCRQDSLTDPLPDPGPANLLVRPVAGNHQVFLPGSELPDPLVVEVFDLDARSPSPGVSVFWEVVLGDGAVLESDTVVTDAQGRAANRFALGSGLGQYVVRATVGREDQRWFDFEARAVETMVLSDLSVGSAAPGDIVGLLGTGFLSTPDSNVVLFSGVRGRVFYASPTRLDVEVPACLPERSVDVSVGLGWVRSESRGLTIRDAQDPTLLDVGADLVLAGSGVTACLRLGAPGEYVAVVQSPTSMAERTFQARFLGVQGDLVVPQAGGTPGPVVTHGEYRGPQPETLRAGSDWEEGLRRRERELIEAGWSPGARDLAAAAAAASVPELGEVREFEVLNRGGGFDPVTATARWVGSQVAIFVDQASPAPGLGDPDLEALGAKFEDPIFSVVSGSFGMPSDIDGNRRVVVLLTPRVNALSGSGEDGIVGGFFYAGDLLPGEEGSNGGEVFYSLVPDPGGTMGPSISVDEVKLWVPAVLAHELQHMIHFNRRVFESGALTGETLWLSEGLAHLAEQLVADTLSARGESEEAAVFLRANLLRGQEYMDSAGSASALQDAGTGTLAERGGAWLFTRYVEEHFRTASILERLTATALSGEANVEAATGLPFADLFSGWSAAVYTDGQGALTDALLVYPFTDLRGLFSAAPGGYTLAPEDLGDSEWEYSGSIPGGGSAYFLFTVPAGDLQGTALGIGRWDGGPTAPLGQLRVRIIRTS